MKRMEKVKVLSCMLVSEKKELNTMQQNSNSHIHNLDKSFFQKFIFKLFFEYF